MEEQPVVFVEHGGFEGLGGWKWEYEFGEEDCVEDGEDDERDVFDADHAAGGEDDHEGEGDEMTECEGREQFVWVLDLLGGI